ncbi:MATE family efflux transporter [Adlercreutzia sp. ZJ154]|uniref:MATE family efflux transporter n=1 Tax=Adlercreutzia sp. ZJ154 TaxID=2709790 RepID=UPI0013EBBE3C|nr:MATE family efflux transporter [Adlercreutzia sp. ZJ154]
MPVSMDKHFNWVELLKFTLPSIVMFVFTSLYGIVDGLCVSNFAGKTAFAAVNLIMPPIMILSTVGFMFGTGGSALVAKTRGEGRDELANRYFSLIVYTAIVLGFILAIVGIITLEPIAYFLGANDDMVGMCVLYGRIIMISLPCYVLQYVFQSFCVTAGKPTFGLIVIVIAGCANMILDVVFVGLLDWGVAGAAMATNVSEILGGGIPLIYFFRKNKSFLRLGKTSFMPRALGKTCVNGLSEMMTSIAMSIVSMLYNFQLMQVAGENGVAAYGVIAYVVLIFAAIFMGFDMGSAPLMSYQYGAKNKIEMKSLLKKGLIYTGVGGVLMFVAGQLLAGLIVDVFVGYDAELRDFTVHGFRIYAIAFLLMGFSMYGSSFFTALNNGVVSAAISFLRTLVFETSAVIFLPMVLGIDGIWLSVSVAELAALVVTVAFMLGFGPKYGYWHSKKNKPRLIT